MAASPGRGSAARFRLINCAKRREARLGPICPDAPVAEAIQIRIAVQSVQSVRVGVPRVPQCPSDHVRDAKPLRLSDFYPLSLSPSVNLYEASNRT
jgi:hypothetical protein